VVRLVVLGPHTQLTTPLCAACPHSPAGCCISPPPMDLSDVARIAALDGSQWLRDEIANGRLEPAGLGLRVTKRRGRTGPTGPRVAKCVYHGDRGCTVPEARRAATCNYYVCESALVATDERDPAQGARARAAHAQLQRDYERWEGILAREAAERFPEGAVFDDATLEWLAARWEELTAGTSIDPSEPEPASP
jgi:hypothetical protein